MFIVHHRSSYLSFMLIGYRGPATSHLCAFVMFAFSRLILQNFIANFPELLYLHTYVYSLKYHRYGTCNVLKSSLLDHLSHQHSERFSSLGLSNRQSHTTGDARMAELLGAVASSITIAGLFKACIEAFELIRTAKNHEVDLKKLKLRLDIEKCRLYNWGESMGLTDTSEASESRPIDRFRFLDIVRDILELIIRLFHDSDKIRDKYGCRPCTTLEICESEQVAMFGSLASSFSNFSVRFKPSLQQSNVAKTVTWVIHDRKKFVGLVTEIKELVDSLQGITSPCVSVARQQGNMRRRIVSVDDAETLSLIAEVCAEDHPDVAKVASDRADTISLASTHKHHVLAWTASVEAAREDVQDRQSPDLESLTHAEVLQKYRELRQTLKDSGKSSDLQTPIPAPNLSDPLRSQPQSPALGAGQLHHTYTKPASPYEEAKLIDIETDAIVKRVTSMHRYSAHTESLERQQGKQHWFIG